jgi:hypothetical protein
MLCLWTSVVYASDTTDLLEKYQEMQYSTEAGITKVDYDRKYRELYIATQKAQGKIPQGTYDKFSSALKSYNNAAKFWNFEYEVYYFSDVKDYIENPTKFKEDTAKDVFGRYDRDCVVAYFFGEANDKTKALTKELSPASTLVSP